MPNEPTVPVDTCSMAGPNGSRVPTEEPHAWVSRKGPDNIWVRTCHRCPAIDWDDLREGVLTYAATLTPASTVPASMGEPLSEGADMRREIVLREINQGALAGMSSEITGQAADLILAALDTYDAWKAQQEGGDLTEVKAALRPPYMLALANLVTDAQTDHPHGGASPAIVHGCVIYDAKHLRNAVRTVWTRVPALLDELDAKREQVGVLEGQLAKAREELDALEPIAAPRRRQAGSRERYRKHAAWQSFEHYLKQAEAAARKWQKEADWLRGLRDTRKAEEEAGTWPPCEGCDEHPARALGLDGGGSDGTA